MAFGSRCLLTCALLITSPHSGGLPGVHVFADSGHDGTATATGWDARRDQQPLCGRAAADRADVSKLYGHEGVQELGHREVVRMRTWMCRGGRVEKLVPLDAARIVTPYDGVPLC